MSKNYLPVDFYFGAFTAEDEFGIPSVVLTTKEFWDKNKHWDDSIGSHSLSKDTIASLNRAGIYGNGELMEAVFEVTNPEATKDEIVKKMIAEGFTHNEEMEEF